MYKMFLHSPPPQFPKHFVFSIQLFFQTSQKEWHSIKVSGKLIWKTFTTKFPLGKNNVLLGYFL